VPELQDVVLWGLCDAASAAMMYAHSDRRVSGLVLLNPWARTDAGQAQTLLKHYYVRRLLSADFWRNLVSGKLAVGKALRSLVGNVKQAASQDTQAAGAGNRSFIERMEEGFDAFRGRSLLIMSGDDLTAAEFRSLVGASRSWRRLLARESCEQREIAEANHTFSSREWRRQVEDWTRDWVLLLC
jgi:exosortase A-associated hydrolase 1